MTGCPYKKRKCGHSYVEREDNKKETGKKQLPISQGERSTTDPSESLEETSPAEALISDLLPLELCQ
jgi:hypothetical protein